MSTRVACGTDKGTTREKRMKNMHTYIWLGIAIFGEELFLFPILSRVSASLQCYSVLSDFLVKNELCILLERGSIVLSTGESFICISLPSKLKIAVL